MDPKSHRTKAEQRREAAILFPITKAKRARFLFSHSRTLGRDTEARKLYEEVSSVFFNHVDINL